MFFFRKNLFQKNYFRGFAQTLAQVRLEEGYAGWYSGLRVHLLRVIPNNAIMFTMVEYITGLYARRYS